MTHPQRIQLSRRKGFKLPPNTVVVSRPSKWGNPYRASDYTCCEADGAPMSKAKALPLQRALALRDYEGWLMVADEGEAIVAAAKQELRGKNLACWCPIGQPCHADELLEVANGATP